MSKQLMPDEQKIEESFGHDSAWKSTLTPDLKSSFMAAAETTLRKRLKDKTITLRISSADLEAIKKRAEDEGLPYQNLIGSVLHKFVKGTLTVSYT